MSAKTVIEEYVSETECTYTISEYSVPEGGRDRQVTKEEAEQVIQEFDRESQDRPAISLTMFSEYGQGKL